MAARPFCFLQGQSHEWEIVQRNHLALPLRGRFISLSRFPRTALR